MKDKYEIGSSHLPSQKVTERERTLEWKKASVNYYINFRYTNGTLIRSDRNKKIINYDLMNGKIDIDDIRKICDPNGDASATFSETFQHHDKISQIIHELLGEESIKPDSSMVFSESSGDITRKTKNLKSKLIAALEQTLMAEIDPSTIDPNNPPPPPEEILKIEKQNPSDILEGKANKLLKLLKKKLNTKLIFNQGFKDALIAGEEIYWVGINNGEPNLRRVNPLNLTVILDDNDIFIDDAVAVIEERLLTIPSIIDEFGDELTKSDLDKLENYTNGVFGTFNTAGGFTPIFNVEQGQQILSGVTPSSSSTGANSSNFSLRVTRVEWMGMKQVGTLEYTDIETGESITKLVDESFKSIFKEFKEYYEDAKVNWFWINEAWEGIRIGEDIHLGIRAKPNQRRRMDNPYYCKLGYTGLIYEATNSKSVSMIDRLKSYQYLYNIISWKLQLVFASDMGRVLLMDMAQIPRSEGVDIEQWMYYLKELKIAFINSFEEGKKGMAQGKLAGQHFNQFQSIDLSLTNSIQQYINYLQFIDQQIYAVSGVNPQRMGKIHQDEAVGNVQQTLHQSETVTQYLFDGHQEVKRRTYTALIEVAKMAYKNGLVTQYVNDDLTIEMLNIEEFEFENSELGVFVSNLNSDKLVKEKLEQFANIAMEQQKADLSTIAETVLNDSPKDILNVLKRAESEFYKRTQQQSDNQVKADKEKQSMEALEKEKDRELEKYITDSDNETKIRIAEINTYIKRDDTDLNNNGIPDPSEIANLALKEREMASKAFNEQSKLSHDRNKHIDEIKAKERIEDKKLEQIKEQNKNQEKLAAIKLKNDQKIADKKLQLEKLKIKNKNKK